MSNLGPSSTETPPVPAQRSACTMSSMVSNKFSRLLQALEMQQALTLQGIQAAETRALAQAQGEEQRLQDQLDALAQDSRRIRDLLGEGDSQAFLQVADVIVGVGGRELACVFPGTRLDYSCHSPVLRHPSSSPSPHRLLGR